MFENDPLSCPPSLGATILSRPYQQYKKAHHSIKKLFFSGSHPDPRIYRITAVLCIIHILIFLQTLTTSVTTGTIDLNHQAVDQIRILNLQKTEHHDLQVTTPEGSIFESREDNGSHTEVPQMLQTGTATSLMEYARDTAAKACKENEAQDEGGHKQILVRPSTEDAWTYFSLGDNSILEQVIHGGFLFDCLKPQIGGVKQQQQRPQGRRDLVSISQEGEEDQKDLVIGASKQLASRLSALSALYNLALASLSVFVVYSCSTGRTPESKGGEVLQTSLIQAPTARKIALAPIEPIRRPEPKEPLPVAVSVPVVQATNISKETDDELVRLGLANQIRLYSLEAQLGDATRAVEIRRRVVAGNIQANQLTSGFTESGLPFKDYDYQRVAGACCENVIGYLPVPVGVAGPLNMDGKLVFLPMATTEGALVASTNRGCTAINASGGVTSLILADGMTRGPCVRFPNLKRAAAAKLWLDSDVGLQTVETAFNSTSRFGRLQSIKCAIAGSDLFIRFKARTGDAMGMNMISKGVECALRAIVDAGFNDMTIISVSGNYCTDKKAAAINWVDGRGKSVAAQATITAETLKKVLKTDVNSMVELNTSKNLIGSCIAGSIGGFNAHAANIVSAIFLATGQDIAQNVESSSCLTTMRNVDGNLQISVSMPSIEVGTVGGGTVLEAQGTMLDLLGIRGANYESPGANAQELACIVAAAVLAGELSLCSALAAGSLVSSHMALNRK